MSTQIADNVGRVVMVHKIDGRDPSNAPETTTILTYDESTDAKLLYRVGRIRPGCNNGKPFDVETFETPEGAADYAHELAEWAKGEYALEADERLENRARGLRELVAGWWDEDPARQVVEALAEAIEAGTEGDLLQALAAYDPIPARRRTDIPRRGRRQTQHAG